MAVYRCSRCDEFKDSDWNVCSEDPDDSLGLVCEDCMCELEEDDDEN